MHGGPWRNEPRGCAQEEVVGIPTSWPPGPVPFTLSFQRQKVRHPPGVPRSSVGDPCVPQILLQPRRAPGHTSQGSQGTLFLEVALPALCLPTVLLTHTYSQLPWGGRPGGERARFHLDPALREGFLSQAPVLVLHRVFSPVGVRREVLEEGRFTPGPSSYLGILQ